MCVCVFVFVHMLVYRYLHLCVYCMHTFIRNAGAGIAHWYVWARCPQRCRFNPPLGKFSGRGDFSLGVNMGSNSIPKNTLSDESIN